MISDKKLDANRLNSLKSTGPRTPDGKARSSLNALKHGSLAKSVCLRTENTDRFRAVTDQFFREYNPCGATEIALVNTLASLRWRLVRVTHIEAANVDCVFARRQEQDPTIVPEDFDNADRTGLAYRDSVDSSQILPFVSRYESRLLQQFHKCVERLRALQAERRKNHNPDGLVPPQPIFEMHRSKPDPDSL